MTEPRALVREAGGVELLERLEHLERREPPRTVSVAAPRSGDRFDVDVLIAGGGLWSLLGPLLAKRGLSVLVVERAKVGQAHREWNASRAELQALVRAGLLTKEELEELIVARYERGTCRFAGGGSYEVSGVLDHAVDANKLLAYARSSSEVRILDHASVLGHAANEHGVRVATSEGEFLAKVMIDARGVSSPFATADLVCPTVGGVMTGLEFDPKVGEILATVDPIEEGHGRQHVWEGFPGRDGELTVYLFYYARKSERVSLIELYARFFETLPHYKRGEGRLLRPTFGLIPGWSRLTPPPASDHPRVILVGDAAARHSPLTYCGFGATLRSLEACADEALNRVEQQRAPALAVNDAPVHALTGLLAHMMASRAFSKNELNDLLDAAFKTLHELGDEQYGKLLRDEMSTKDFVRFLHRTSRRHPKVWGEVMRGVGPWTAGRWGLGIARQLLHDVS